MRLLSKLLDSGESAPVAGFVGDDVTRQILSDAADGKGSLVRPGGPAEAIDWLSRGVIPKLLVVDFSASDDAARDAAQVKDAAGNGSRLLAIGQVNDISLYRELLRLGYADYLVKPVSADVLRASIAAVTEAKGNGPAAQAAPEGGRTVLVVGTRGGCGASTVATNAAWIMAEELDRRSALLDLDLQFGTASLALNLAPSRGLAEALLNPDRIDQLFVASAMMQEGRNLSVLSAEEALDRHAQWDPVAVESLVRELRRSYDWIWIDLPRALVTSQRELVGGASHILLVTELTLPAMRDALRLFSLFSETAPKAKIIVIANRTGTKSPVSVSRQEFEKAVGAKIDLMLPEEPQTLAQASTAGKALPAVAKRSKLVEQIRALDRMVIGAPGGKTGAPLWRFLSKK